MTQYDIDDEVQAFIDRSNSFYTEETAPDIHRMRECYNTLCRAFAQPYPEGATSKDREIDHNGYALKLRHYQYQNKQTDIAVIYYHGGGFVLGGLDSHDDACAEICAQTAMDVISVDYRLAPEHIHPCQFDDTLFAFNYFSNEYEKLIVAGDSAGGTLAAAVCYATKHQASRPIGQVLIYPSLGGGALNLASYVDNADAPMLTTSDMDFYLDAHSGGQYPVDDPTFHPLAATSFENLPPCYAFSADIDPLRDDAEIYVERLQQAGVEAKWINEPGLVHGYLRARHSSRKARQSFDAICHAISTLGTQDAGAA